MIPSLAHVKKDFPVFEKNPGLVYLDSAATSLRPKSVIAKIKEYYEEYSANVHRGFYPMAEKATEEYEGTRDEISEFLGVERNEIIFTRGTTEGLNLLAYSLASELRPGDGVVATVMEHHSNFVPWQEMARKQKAEFRVLDIDDAGRLRDISPVLTPKTKIVALAHVSNVLGTINPVSVIIEKIRRQSPYARIVIDAAQSVPHMRVLPQDLGCDFLVFSGHKMFGPSGVGVLWGKSEILEKMEPFQFGGKMISEVHVDRAHWREVPYRFEAGTPNIAGVVAFKEAVRYLKGVGIDSVLEHERGLLQYAMARLSDEFAGAISIYGPPETEYHAGVVSFSMAGIHAHDVAHILGEAGIAVRTGHHCAMPLHERLGVPATVRASFHLYNTKDDIDALLGGLRNVIKLFRA